MKIELLHVSSNRLKVTDGQVLGDYLNCLNGYSFYQPRQDDAWPEGGGEVGGGELRGGREGVNECQSTISINQVYSSLTICIKKYGALVVKG